ncbi:MAG: exodeoxyribonuclease VII large subunit, partial [Oscillospiraceae bacterium]|nr:exodeoxyribonuclease VII large subunit [Oscillospiraceae bacterium]
TLLDLAADERAPTPSAAAELAVPDVEALLGNMRSRLADIRTGAAFALEGARERLSSLSEGVYEAALSLTDRAAAELEAKTRLLEALDPAKTLSRGYALVLNREGSFVESAAWLAAGEQIAVRLRDGELDCLIKSVREEK